MAFKPLYTLTGNALPVWGAQTADGSVTAIDVGDIVYRNSSGVWVRASDPVTERGVLGVAMDAATTANATIGVCIVTPDVVFQAPGEATLSASQPYQLDGANGEIKNTQATKGTHVPGYVLETIDSTNNIYAVVIGTIG